MQCLYLCLLPCSLLLPYLCWCIAMLFCVLPPPAVSQRDSMKLVARNVCWVHVRPSAHTQYKQNWDPLVKTLLHSATSGEKICRIPLRTPPGICLSWLNADFGQYFGHDWWRLTSQHKQRQENRLRKAYKKQLCVLCEKVLTKHYIINIF